MSVKEENKTEIGFQPLINYILDGDVSQALDELEILKNSKVKPEKILTAALEPVVLELDKKCTIEYFNLLEIMLAGRVIMAIVNDLFPQGIPLSESKGTIVIATIQGDIHDLGKNIVCILLTASGYKVIDCGKDCPIMEVIDSAERENAEAILISGLISTIISDVKKIRGMLQQRDLANIKLIAGGGALKQSNADFLNVDYVAVNVFDGIEYLNGQL